MHVSIDGIYRDGKVELLESPPVPGNARVIVTFLPPPGEVALVAMGISQAEAAEMRARLSTFAEDWDRPEMDVYDEY